MSPDCDYSKAAARNIRAPVSMLDEVRQLAATAARNTHSSQGAHLTRLYGAVDFVVVALDERFDARGGRSCAG